MERLYFKLPVNSFIVSELIIEITKELIIYAGRVMSKANYQSHGSFKKNKVKTKKDDPKYTVIQETIWYVDKQTYFFN